MEQTYKPGDEVTLINPALSLLWPNWNPPPGIVGRVVWANPNGYDVAVRWPDGSVDEPESYARVCDLAPAPAPPQHAQTTSLKTALNRLRGLFHKK